jgi:hypothetical protein
MRNLANQRFGRLVAQQDSGKRNRFGQVIWDCICDCGKTTSVWSSNLVCGGTQSCGCLLREVTQQKARVNHQRAIKPLGPRNSIWSNYRSKARRLDIEFSLNREEFDVLTQGNCYWCGLPPANISKAQSGLQCEYSGIDRLRADEGYIIGNCVSCCKRCNFMKSRMSVVDFLAHIDRIAKKHLAGTKYS